MTTSVFYNRTRESASIPRKLLRERKPYLIPVYYAMLTSEMAREGIRNSGSYRFADHIYANQPKGRLVVGTLLDRALLSFPSARAFRARYLYAKDEIRRLIAETQQAGAEMRILAVPSGYARELFEVADELRASDPAAYARVRWHCLDLDAELLDEVRARARQAGHDIRLACGDALAPESYPAECDMLISMGFTEFLDDAQVARFFEIAHSRLRSGGRLVTSGLQRHRVSDYLLRNIGELHSHYRSEKQLRELVARAGFANLLSYRDATGLQTMVVGTKE